MQTILKIILGLFALLFLGFGGAFMFAPTAIIDMFAMTPASADNTALAWSTVRGDMGGAFLTLSIAMALGLATGNKTWLQASMLLLGTIFVGRAVGIVAHGGDQQIYFNMGAEALCVILLWLYSRGLD